MTIGTLDTNTVWRSKYLLTITYAFFFMYYLVLKIKVNLYIIMYNIIKINKKT